MKKGVCKEYEEIMHVNVAHPAGAPSSISCNISAPSPEHFENSYKTDEAYDSHELCVRVVARSKLCLLEGGGRRSPPMVNF